MFLTVDVDELTVSCRTLADLLERKMIKRFSLIKLCLNLVTMKFVYGVQELSSSWDIKATPTFFFLKDGQQVDKLVGANKPELQKKVTAILDSTTQ